MAGNQGNNRIEWTQEQLDFLLDNWQLFTAEQLSAHLGIKRTKVREKLYEQGLYKMKLEYWTGEQIEYLRNNYEFIGDTELAEIFNEKWQKEKGWTKKHIEKKRRYLNLKRSDEAKLKIHCRNKANGMWAMCPVRAWETRGGATPVGERRMWVGEGKRMFMVIKLKDGFVHYAQWLYQQIYGPVPAGMIVRLKDGDPFNVTPGNLIAVTRSDHAILNKKNALPKEIREIVLLNQKLQKVIYDKSRETRSAVT